MHLTTHNNMGSNCERSSFVEFFVCSSGKATIGDTLINRCGDSYAGRLRDEGRRRTPPFRCLLEKRVHILNFNCRNYMLQAKVIH